MVYYLSTPTPPMKKNTERHPTAEGRHRGRAPLSSYCGCLCPVYEWVDKLDQMTRQNKSKKCMKWYRRVETKLMETSLYNAYVIEGHAIDHKVGNVVKRDFLSFRLDLAHKLH